MGVASVVTPALSIAALRTRDVAWRNWSAIEQTNGDRPAMGKLLGLERNTLRYKLNKYGLLDR